MAYSKKIQSSWIELNVNKKMLQIVQITRAISHDYNLDALFDLLQKLKDLKCVIKCLDGTVVYPLKNAKPNFILQALRRNKSHLIRILKQKVVGQKLIFVF